MTEERRRIGFALPQPSARIYIRRPFPGDSLAEVVKLAQAIQDSNNGRPINRVLLADAIGRKPASSAYKELLSSSYKYGLTLGTEKSDAIELTPVGVSLTKPRDTTERGKALRQAAMQPELFARIYQHYNNGKLPQGEFFHSVLERDFGVPRERCAECASLLVENGALAGIIRELQGTLYVLLDVEPASGTGADIDPGEDLVREQDGQQLTPTPTPTAKNGSPAAPLKDSRREIFIGHGKNRKPMEQLRQVLRQFGIEGKVAIDEPQVARPISQKVAEEMRKCHSAILIFTADEEFKDSDGNSVWRPSENVVYELGAASVLYENRIVIFKEEGVDFPTNFRDIGHISFQKDQLDTKGLELVKELVALGLLKVQPA